MPHPDHNLNRSAPVTPEATALPTATVAPAEQPLRPATAQPHYRSKTAAAWLALLLGTLGMHRLYLYGMRDIRAWLHVPPTAVGLLGVLRMQELGQDDHLAWLLIPVLGLMISIAMLMAIIYALTPDDRWHQRYNPGRPMLATGWGAVMAAILALLLGGAVLMGSIAFAGQKFFEWQLQPEVAVGQNSQRLTP